AFYRWRNLLAVVLGQRRLIVEQVDVREAARLEKANDAFGLRREVRQGGPEGVCGRRGASETVGLPGEQHAERRPTDSRGSLAQECPARKKLSQFLLRIHGTLIPG